MKNNQAIAPKNIQPLRTFLAIELDPITRDILEQVIMFLRNHYRLEKMTWVKPINLHVTVRFIGDTSTAQIPSLIARVREALANLPAFSLVLSGVAFFPSHHPHVIAINFTLSQELAQLLLATEQAVVACGFMPETRSFQPHLTLARFSHPLKSIPEIPIKLPQTLAVNKIILFKSDLTPNGSLYTPLEYFAFG
jgi:2'-5' RNA ligase